MTVAGVLALVVAGTASAATAKPTASKVATCLKAAGAQDVTTPRPALKAFPSEYGSVLGRAPTGNGIGVYLFTSKAQASSYIVDIQKDNPEDLIGTANGGFTVLLVEKAAVGNSKAMALLSRCTAS
jgi:hypothetical protein